MRITRRFTDGPTAVDAREQWRDGEYAPASANSKNGADVLLTFRCGAAKCQNLTVIAAAYKRQFRQQLVLTSLGASCVTF